MGPSGLYYDVHNLANLLVALPIAGAMNLLGNLVSRDLSIIGKFIFSLTGLVWCSLAVLFYFKTCLLLKMKKEESFFSALMLAFCTVIFQYSSLNYEGNIYLFSAIGSFYFYKKYFLEGNGKDLLFFGLLLGLSANSRDMDGIMIVLYALAGVSHFIKKELKTADLKYFLVGFLPGMLLFSFYNYLRTGSFFKLALFYGLEQKEWGTINPVNPFWEGFLGQLFSPGFSIFLYSPLLLLTLFGMWRYRDKFSWESKAILLGTLFLTICAVSKIPNWKGFSGVGNRYTYLFTPFLFLSLPLLLEEKGVMKKLAMGLAAWGALLQLSLTSINWKPLLITVMENPGSSRSLTGSVWFLGLKEFVSRLFLVESTTDLSMLSPASQYASETYYTWWMRIVPMGGSLWMSLLVGAILATAIVLLGRIVFSDVVLG